jgi:hypothetical protein
VIDEVDVGEMFMDMVAGKCEPKRLLCVVVHMVIAVPRRPDVAVAPIGEQPQTGCFWLDGAVEEIQIVIPHAL